MKKNTLPYTLKGMQLRFHPVDHISKITGENRTYSDLPASKGLSSSAAMSVTVAAVTEILHKYPNLHEKRIKNHIDSPEFQKKYAETAYQGERIELGINCSQMDPYASALGGFLHIGCSHEPPTIEKYAPEEEMTIIIGDTNQPKDTPRILAWLGKRFQQREETFMEGVTNITEIVRDARKELSKRNLSLEKLGTLMNQNQHYIKYNLKVSGDCPISPSNFDTLVQAALNGGAHGAKVTGSGGGGCMIALCDPHSSHQVARNIDAAGGSAITTVISMQGIRLEAILG